LLITVVGIYHVTKATAVNTIDNWLTLSNSLSATNISQNPIRLGITHVQSRSLQMMYQKVNAVCKTIDEEEFCRN